MITNKLQKLKMNFLSKAKFNEIQKSPDELYFVNDEPVGIAEGGTGATTGTQALANLGAKVEYITRSTYFTFTNNQERQVSAFTVEVPPNTIFLVSVNFSYSNSPMTYMSIRNLTDENHAITQMSSPSSVDGMGMTATGCTKDAPNTITITGMCRDSERKNVGFLRATLIHLGEVK